MKRLLFLFLMLFLANAAFSQLEVKDDSFKEVMGFVNINTEKMYDDNDQPYAVLKIKTVNLSSKERRELNFGGDARTFFEAEYKDGEVWLYISYYASFIKISHEELSSTEFYFPFDMQPKKGYELTLVNKTASAISGSGSLTVNTKPENGATITLNGKVLNQKTPYSNDMIAAGQYEISVSKERYKTVTETITIADGDNKNIEITLPIDVATITITADAQTDVYVDGNLMKRGTWSGELYSGQHKIVYKKQYYNDAEQTITVEAGIPATFNLNLNPIYGKINITSEPAGATVYIDGKEYGVTPLEVTDVVIGPHELRLEKNNYSFVVKRFVIEEGKLFTINENMPTGRKILITTGKRGDELYIDGEYAGLSPLTTILAFGDHSIKAVRNNKMTFITTTVAQTGESSVKLSFKFENKSYTINGVSFEMIAVKGGTYLMGHTDDLLARTTHYVTLDDYYIGRFEVTQKLWQAVMGNNPSYYKSDSRPVADVAWNDVQEFIRKLNNITGANFRLPTEAEWEYAARGGNKSKGYIYSGSNNIGDVAWYKDNSGDKTHPVGTKIPNELGIYDMSGNVSEWCQDWYGDYSSVNQINPTGANTGEYRVFRGGDFYNKADDSRVFDRGMQRPNFSCYSMGFRLVLVP